MDSISPGAIVGAGVVLGLLAARWIFAWGAVLRWLRVLWVCRIPALSAGLGLLLFWQAEPARDLFMESQLYTSYWISFFWLALLWAVSVHFSARKALEQQAWAAPGEPLPLEPHRLGDLRLCYRPAATWIPRLLGLLCLAGIGLGIWGAHDDVAPIQKAFLFDDSTKLFWGVGIVCLLYLLYVVFRGWVVSPRERREPFWSYLADQLTGRTTTLLTEPRAFWFLDLATARGRAARAVQNQGPIPWDVAALLLLLAQAACWITAIIVPLSLAEQVSRAPFVVLMLGLPVSLLAFLSSLSHQWRVPVVGLTLLGLVILTGLQERFHDLRTVKTPDDWRRLTLAEAVAGWKAANCSGDAKASCPARPVIVASAGGASRAAFFTATVVGDIIDREPSFRNRLFAFSGVSGGAVGSAMIRSAMTEASSEAGPPCDRLDSLWFGPAENYGHSPGQQPIGWKACLQTLLAGDFLSPAFIGLAFRDLFGFLVDEDRAVLLERAFERRYDRLVPRKPGAERFGLARLVGEGPTAQAGWAPRLLQNTTSVDDGRRLVITDLQPDLCDGGRQGRVLPLAYDLFETMAHATGDCASGQPRAGRTLRLSSAAAASARFPVVSPQAGLRGDDGTLRAMLVDGGYFENDGITTARELAKALDGFGLRAVIVPITNNPTTASTEGPGDRLPAPHDPTWYDVFTAPLAALVGTRNGHAVEASHKAEDAGLQVIRFQVYDRVPMLRPGQGCRFDGEPGTIDTSGKPMKDLSMSWWLSGAVQGYLDRQLCHPENKKSYEALKAALTGP
ncbi:hypothetical protein [Methylobacterium sp. C25]|uniref:hypothetical protein n=1 Tax=Methylobacterium sp. C25 TaxID=2721622 RepID=UPI001F23C419|nr:hypothetical protein [Methylobacterium sp. C25]